MKINKLNYEAFALEYLEGTLPLEEREAMEQFLLQHPTIQAELEGMKDFPILMPEPILFENKRQLLKQVSRDRVIWMNPLRWSAAASILFAVTFIYYSKNTTIEPIVATVPHNEVTVPNPTNSVPPMEAEINKEELVVINKKEKEEILQIKEALISKTNQDRKKKRPTEMPHQSVIQKKELIADYSASKTPLATAPNHSSTTAVAFEKESNKETIITNQISLIDQEAKAAISVASLSTKSIALVEVSKEVNSTFENAITQAINNSIVEEETAKRRTLKSFIGRLPGKGIKVSIVPSFFTD